MLMVSAPEKFLVVHQGALGDFVTCFPGILLLRKNGYSVDVVQRPELGQLACFLNLADNFFSIESSWFASL
ncbi:hypothetical protein QUF76_16470, partial [Desulfobacterales bacterium HSG16]|nr:hypothetical protein [Desulfobacterales bacterium HSG16]